LLLHGLGVNEWNALNFPSWSISSEFAAYVVFAGIVFRVGSSTLPWLFMLILGPAVLWLSPYAMDSTYDFGWTRCLYGFAAGVLCYSLRDALPAMTRRLDFRIDTLIEAAAVILTIWFVTAAGDNRPLSLCGPLLFAGVVLIFAREAGGVSQLLLCRPFLVVGMLTYSIYMLHALVRAVTRAAAMVLEHFLGIPLLRIEIIHHNPEPTKVLWLNGSLWLGDLLQISMLCTTIALAALTYRYVEEPGRNWSRKLAGKAAVKVGISPSPSLTSPADAR
jgi:peptidoglycan/LPS O-acetylase OafA/YrhL